ncbi:hypothetical protein B0H11DRAFT_1899166 [Mycena galericulata]|nr:hypothetical protein B0H11DRAFT_1899166 [Mycena galericulata]
MRLARIEDASGAMQKFRNDLLAFKNRIATETQQRQREKDAEAAAEKHRLEAIIVITDPAKLKKLSVKKVSRPFGISLMFAGTYGKTTSSSRQNSRTFQKRMICWRQFWLQTIGTFFSYLRVEAYHCFDSRNPSAVIPNTEHPA